MGAARAAGRPIRPGAEAVQIDESLSRAAGLPNELRKYAHQLPKGLGKPQRYQTKFDGIKEGYYLTIKDMSPGLTGDYRSRGGDLTAVFSIQNIIKQLEGAAKKGRHIVLVRGEGRAPALAESATKSVGAIVGAVLKGDSAPAQVDEANLSKDIMAALKAAKKPISLRDLTIAIADANAAIKGLDARIVDKGLAKLVLAGKVTRGKGQGTRGVYSMAEEIDEAATVMRETADGVKVDGGKPGQKYFRFGTTSDGKRLVTAWYVESAHPKKVQGKMQDSFKKAVQTWERSGRFPSGSDITVESLDEAAPKPVTLSMSDQVAMNSGPKGAGITPAIHAWATKKFGKGNAVTITKLDVAQKSGKIEIHTKNKGITITVRGQYVIVKTEGKPVQFFELNESVDEALTPADRKVVKAFVDKKPMEGKRLSTDGRSLDWNGMGGRGVATWGGGKIQLGDTGSSKDSEAHRAIKKEAPKNWIVESLDEAGSVDEATFGELSVGARFRLRSSSSAKEKKHRALLGDVRYDQTWIKTGEKQAKAVKGSDKHTSLQPGQKVEIVEANDDKTDDLPAKAEADLKAKAKEMGAVKVSGKGPSVNATFDSQEKAQRFLKHAKTVGKAAMRRSGDTEFTVHIDEDGGPDGPDGLPEGVVEIGDGRFYYDGELYESREALDEATCAQLDEAAQVTAAYALANMKHGDRVTINVPTGMGRGGQEWKPKNGKAVMRGPHGWAINLGGKHGTPGVATEKNLVKWNGKTVAANESLDEGADPISVEITGIFDNGEWQHPRYTVNVVTNNGDSYNFGMFEPGTAPDSQHTHAEWPSFTNPLKGEVRRGEHMTTIPLAQVPGPLRKQLKALLADATSWQDELEFDEGVVDVAEQARWAPGLYEANRRVLRGSELEQAARSGEVLVIGAGGLQRQTGIKLFPNTAYWMGASTSPDMIVVTAVTDDRVTFASYPYTKTRSDMIRYVMGLIADGTKTHMKQYAAYIDPKQKATWEKNLKGEKGPLNGKQKLQDFQYVLVTCAANGKTRDLYGETKAYGVLVGYYESGSSKAIDGKETSTIKVQRVSVPQMKADPAFDVVKVGRKVVESADDLGDWLVENELEEFTSAAVPHITANPWIGAYHSEMQLVLGEPDDLDDDCDGTYLDEHGNVQPLQEGSVTLERKPSGMTGEQFFVVMRDGDPIGFISKLKNTRSITYPWKAFRYKGQVKGDGTDAYDFLGATYAKGATGKRVASNAVVTGRKLTEEVFPESYVERVRETAGYVIEDAYSDCDNAKAAGNTHVVLSGPAQHPTFCASEYEAEALASASSGAIVLTIPEFEEQLAAMESAYLDEGQLNEAIPPTVEGFRMFLVGALTQYDQTQLTRSLKNPRAYHNANALALYLQAIDRVFKDRVMRGVTAKSADPEALRKFRAAIADYFDPKFPPVKKTLKALDAFLDTGRAPNYPGASKRRSKKEPLSEAYEFVWEHADLFHANADVGTLDEAMNAYKLLMSADKGLINTLDNGRKKLVNAIARAQKEQRNMEQRMGVGQTTAKDQLAIIIKELKAYHDLVGRLLSSSELAEGLDEELITVKVTASNGDYWTTQIQGPFAKAKAYFMGNEFNIGRGGQDLMVKVKKVELVEDALDETQTGSALITFGTKEKRDEAVRAVRNHEGPFACTIANCDETQLRVFWPEAATTSDDEMVEKISSATEHGLFAQLGLKYVSINSVVVEDCDEDGEPLDEASKGATLRDQVQGIFVRNQGTSYTAEDIARLLTISKTEAMKILSSLVTAGTLAFKRGWGYSVRRYGLTMPGSGPHRRGSLASRISDRRTYTHEDEEDDQLDELGNSGRPANWRDGMATAGQAFQARGSAKTKARFANTQLRRVGGGEVPEFASDVSKLSKSMKALKYKGTKGESYEVVHKGRVLGTVSSSGGGMFPWAGRNKQGQKIDQTGYGNLHLAVTRMLASSLGDAWGSAEEDFDETTTSGGVGGFGRATIGGYPENKGREGGIRDDGKHKRGPKSRWSPGALAKIAEQMRESMPEHADEPDEFFAELIERVVKAVEVYPKRKGGPWLVADPFGNETEHPTKEAAVAAGRAVAETENWGFVVSDGKLAQESVDEAGSKLKVKCGECGKVFATKPSGYPRCPKCKSFDIDIAEAAVDNKRPVRLGPIEKELLKMLRRERGKHGIEELIAASALLQTLPYEDVNIAAQNLATLGLVGGNGRGILLPFGEDDEDLDEAEVRYPYRIETSGGSGGKLAGVRFYADDAQAKADVTKLAAREQVGRVTTVKRMTAAEAKAEKVPYPNESIDEVTLSNYEVQQRRRGTPVESHWQGGNLTIAKTKALELSRTDSTGIAYVKKHGAGASKVVAAYYKGKPYNESADEDVLDEASIKTGNPEVPEIGFARGTYYYVGKSGAKNSVAIPPAKRKDKKFAETKFRQMLSNEAGGGMGQTAASKLIDKLNAQLGESDESFQTDETELIEFPESMLETYVLAAQAAGLDDDPRFVYEDGAFTAEVPATVAPRIRELVGAAR